jgi:hypothetical protein
MKTKLAQAARDERLKKSIRVRRAWEQSGYEAVIKHFRDNKNLEFIGSMVIALRHVESQIINDLMELDEEVVDEEIGSCVLGHLAQWTEHLGVMAKMLKESSDRAWEELEKIDPV